ncbi:MAG: hypothetical protein WDO16_06520 [Bacteroidota bacterium]
MHGAPGSGVIPVKIDSVIGSSLRFIDNTLPNFATGYYYIDISIGAARIISSPVWYTRNDASGVLPVKLSSFTAQKLDNRTLLKWTTAQEFNTREFHVERSIGGSAWQTIATVAARGNSNTPVDYIAYDANPAKGLNLYRLRSVDFDNKSEYSATRRVNFDAAFTYSIYPNPAKDVLQITTDNASGLHASVDIFNTQSQVLIKKQVILPASLSNWIFRLCPPASIL